MTDGKREIIQRLLSEYDIRTAEDIQEALKDLLGETIKEMMEAEMGHHRHLRVVINLADKYCFSRIFKNSVKS